MINYELRHKNCEDEIYKYDDLILSTVWGPSYSLKEIERAKRRLELDPDNRGIFYIKELEDGYTE